MSEPKTVVSEFHAWFKEQSHRDDAVGWVAKWFLHKGQGRYPKQPSLNPTCEHWLKIVEEKASKAHQLAARSAFITAWNEFHAGSEIDSTVEEFERGMGDVMNVRSTVARLRKIVKGNHERGEIEEEEDIAVDRFSGPVATVGIRQRLTTSYGGDWVQLGVMLSVPCYVEEIEDAFQFADEWVTDKIQSEVNKFKGGGPPERSAGSSDGAHEEDVDQGEPDSEPETEDSGSGEKETFVLEPDSYNDNPPAPEPNDDTAVDLPGGEDFGF